MSAMDYAGSAGAAPRGRRAPIGMALERLRAMLVSRSADKRQRQMNERRARDMELEIERLRAVGGF